MRYVTILLSFASLTACAQLDLEAERRAMLNGDVHGVVQRIEQALQHLPKATPTLEHARLLEMLGEQYHRLSDIGHAKQYWDVALALRQRAFGDSSAEAAVGYAYRARYHNYMGAPQQEHQPLAWKEADRAVRNVGNAKNLSALESVLLQRELEPIVEQRTGSGHYFTTRQSVYSNTNRTSSRCFSGISQSPS
ncbi:MAG: hypothetical protein JNL43_03530 [Flavobacteriales bacterium]|nr:hypothetical protein [Flavobacteriales bacterium]